MIRLMSQCDFCSRHKTVPVDGIIVGEVHHFCEAFPEGIPDAVFLDEYDHTKPYPDDNGVLFSPDDESAGEIQRSLFERT